MKEQKKTVMVDRIDERKGEGGVLYYLVCFFCDLCCLILAAFKCWQTHLEEEGGRGRGEKQENSEKKVPILQVCELGWHACVVY